MDFMDDYTGSLGDAGDLTLESILSEINDESFMAPPKTAVREAPPEYVLESDDEEEPAPAAHRTARREQSSLFERFSSSSSSRHAAPDEEDDEPDDEEEPDSDISDEEVIRTSVRGLASRAKSSLLGLSSRMQQPKKTIGKAAPAASRQSRPQTGMTEEPEQEEEQFSFDTPDPLYSGFSRVSAEDISEDEDLVSDFPENPDDFVYSPSEPEYTGFDRDYRRAVEEPSEDEPEPVEKKMDFTTYYDIPEPDTSEEEGYVPPRIRHNPEFERPAPGPARRGSPFSGLKDRLASRRKADKEDFEAPEDAPVRKPGRSSIEVSDEDFDYVNAEHEFSRGGDENMPEDFKAYLASIFMTIAYKLRGAATVVLTMEEKEEDLGDEVSVRQASVYYRNAEHWLSFRLKVSLVILLVMMWISIGLPVFGMLGTVKVSSAAVMAMQFTILLLSLDVVSNAMYNAVQGKFGLDSMAVISCVVTSVDAFLVACSKVPSEHLALCFLSSASLVGVTYSSRLMSYSLFLCHRVPSIGVSVYSMFCETDRKTREISMLKTRSAADGFVRRSEEAAPDENMYSKIALPMMALALVMGVLTAVITKDGRDLIYLLSIYLCACVPFCGLLCFAWPFYFGTKTIFRSGSAIPSWSGVADIGHCHNLVITDRDLFPGEKIRLSQVRIISQGRPEEVLTYAGTMLNAADSALAAPFLRFMEERNLKEAYLRNFEIVPGGGFKAIIDTKVVLCGNRAFMYLQNVPVSADFVDENSVLLAINGELSGIINVEYEADEKIRTALKNLVASRIHPIFAVHDFNITPKMLKKHFNLPTDGYDFPPFDERFALSRLSEEEVHSICSVVCLEGLPSLVNMAEGGKHMYATTKLNLILVIVSSFFVMLAAFMKILLTGSISILFLFAIMAVITLIVFMNSWIRNS